MDLQRNFGDIFFDVFTGKIPGETLEEVLAREYDPEDTAWCKYDPVNEPYYPPDLPESSSNATVTDSYHGVTMVWATSEDIALIHAPRAIRPMPARTLRTVAAHPSPASTATPSTGLQSPFSPSHGDFETPMTTISGVSTPDIRGTSADNPITIDTDPLCHEDVVERQPSMIPHVATPSAMDSAPQAGENQLKVSRKKASSSARRQAKLKAASTASQKPQRVRQNNQVTSHRPTLPADGSSTRGAENTQASQGSYYAPIADNHPHPAPHYGALHRTMSLPTPAYTPQLQSYQYPHTQSPTIPLTFSYPATGTSQSIHHPSHSATYSEGGYRVAPPQTMMNSPQMQFHASTLTWVDPRCTPFGAVNAQPMPRPLQQAASFDISSPFRFPAAYEAFLAQGMPAAGPSHFPVQMAQNASGDPYFHTPHTAIWRNS